MGHKVKQSLMSSRIDFFYYAFRNVLLVSVPLLIVSSVVLSHLSFHSSAASSSSGVDQIQFSLSSSCTMSSAVDEAHTKEINNGTYHSDVGKTTITTLCNDGNGYSVYAVGYSDNEEGNNKLINSERPEYSIDTGLNTSGLTSAWAMKLNNIPDDPSPTPPVIEPAYDNTYGLVPQYWTRVASRPSGTTDMDEGSSFTTTYAIYTTSNQHAGTYNGQVKYLLTHPSTQVVAYYMQDVANWQNEIPNPGDTLLATDVRDNKEYWVTRLADGHIWMTQNLDFDISSDATLNSSTTDLNEYNVAGYYDGYTKVGDIIYWAPTNNAATIDFEGTTVTNWRNSDTMPYSANKTDAMETGHTSLGNYYNWTAAIASNNSSLLKQNTFSDITKNPQNSICPKGWRLPTISNQSILDTNSTNEFAKLNSIYNDNKTNTNANLIIDPLFFRMSGAIIDGNLNNPNVGYYQSSTTWDTTWLYRFYFSSTSVKVADDYGRRYEGYSIRCIAK